MGTVPNQRTITTKKAAHSGSKAEEYYTPINLIMAWCGFSKNTYTAAFNELVKEGYLIESKEGSSHYDFYEVSQLPPKEPTITVHKEEPREFTF